MGGKPIISLAELRKQAVYRLRKVYPLSESESIIRALFSHFIPEWPKVWLASSGQAPFPEELLPRWENAIARLLRHEPLAYIIGEVAFGSIRLEITPGVFIPRPETEEWAYRLRQMLSKSPPKTILDIGTGSGALAIFFAKEFPYSMVYAIDKSPKAVNLARKNAFLNSCSIRVEQVTFGASPLPTYFPHKWDLIVCNPPYVPWINYAETGLNVRLYEPPDAIFCSGLSLYEKLAEMATKHLSPGGIIAAELFPPDAEAVASLWEAYGLHTALYKDSQERLRWIEAKIRHLSPP
ncbi:MAG: peptide chain release factor N(5)-glutamine methyltransferase [Bacteroidia bacterium]|nr:peptide chain release factor N(5)-glutamine methyltransferase [Bacteroidia bacterium]